MDDGRLLWITSDREVGPGHVGSSRSGSDHPVAVLTDPETGVSDLIRASTGGTKSVSTRTRAVGAGGFAVFNSTTATSATSFHAPIKIRDLETGSVQTLPGVTTKPSAPPRSHPRALRAPRRRPTRLLRRGTISSRADAQATIGAMIVR
ncbi:hypothetical protein ACE2AJ_09990 [Aquihabitans daechungensis]|uniref:hypothetical protein n=1 Tax=Aquihabitans daechungensis TaxID=1052257 RepID=UPI003B9F5908